MGLPPVPLSTHRLISAQGRSGLNGLVGLNCRASPASLPWRTATEGMTQAPCRCIESLEALFSDQFPHRDEHTTVYVARLKDREDLLKVGITSTKWRGLRYADPEIVQILWESSTDFRDQENAAWLLADQPEDEFGQKPCLKALGDLPRWQAWLLEQLILERYIVHRWKDAELSRKRWEGWTETIRVPWDEQRTFCFDVHQLAAGYATGRRDQGEKFGSLAYSLCRTQVQRAACSNWIWSDSFPAELDVSDWFDTDLLARPWK